MLRWGDLEGDDLDDGEASPLLGEGDRCPDCAAVRFLLRLLPPLRASPRDRFSDGDVATTPTPVDDDVEDEVGDCEEEEDDPFPSGLFGAPMMMRRLLRGFWQHPLQVDDPPLSCQSVTRPVGLVRYVASR